MIFKTILFAEKEIFKSFNNNKRFKNRYDAFLSPDSDEVPHWNLVYPLDLSKVYSLNDVQNIQNYYYSKGRIGHLSFYNNKWEKYSVETSEYFVLNNVPVDNQNIIDIKSFSTLKDNNLTMFCKIIKDTFDLDEVTKNYFKNKMELLSKNVESKFWVVSHNGRPCGTTSTFKVSNGAWFMFNVAILPEFQGQKLGTLMLKYVCSQLSSPIYTYSHNKERRNTILPKVGFSPVGVMHVVPISTYEKILSKA